MSHEATRIRSLLMLLTLGTVFACPAHAWKGATHVYLAEAALQDALDDGKVTIYATDYCTGQLKRDASGQLVKIGDYAVNPAMLDAIRANRAQFRAGALGPDVYPDIMVGQMVIHPAGADGPGQPPGKDINRGGPGTEPWLEYLWHMTYSPLVPLPAPAVPPPGGGLLYADRRVPADTFPAVRAFVAGFLAHSATDLHGHTLINYYTGAPFNFIPGPQNAIKHLVLEGYIERRTPPPVSWELSLAGGVDGYIYRRMVDASPGSLLKDVTLRGSGATYTVPNVYSRLRNKLAGNIQHYYDTKRDFDRRYDEKVSAANACAPLDIHCSRVVLLAEAAAIQAAKGAYMAANAAPVTYEERWRDDIDRGLRDWPAVSHELAKALVFSPGGLNKTRASDVCRAYVLDHLLSMSGLPDFVGSSLSFVDGILASVEIPAVKQAISEMQQDLVSFMMKKWTGISLDELEGWVKDPEAHFDQVLNSQAYKTEPGAHLVSLADFSANQLHLAGAAQTFDYRQVPAAYNSVVMVKLTLMTKNEINRLIVDLNSIRRIGQSGQTSRLEFDNVMLGFVRTLDGSSQWGVNPERMAVSSRYGRIFMWQVADEACMPPDSVVMLKVSAPSVPRSNYPSAPVIRR